MKHNKPSATDRMYVNAQKAWIKSGFEEAKPEQPEAESQAVSAEEIWKMATDLPHYLFLEKIKQFTISKKAPDQF